MQVPCATVGALYPPQSTGHPAGRPTKKRVATKQGGPVSCAAPITPKAVASREVAALLRYFLQRAVLRLARDGVLLSAQLLAAPWGGEKETNATVTIRCKCRARRAGPLYPPHPPQPPDRETKQARRMRVGIRKVWRKREGKRRERKRRRERRTRRKTRRKTMTRRKGRRKRRKRKRRRGGERGREGEREGGRGGKKRAGRRNGREGVRNCVMMT